MVLWNSGCMDHSDYPISSVIGKRLYTANGVSIGRVEDVVLDFDQGFTKKLAVTNVNSELFTRPIDSKRGILIPFDWIDVVDDIIITANGIGDQKLAQL